MTLPPRIYVLPDGTLPGVGFWIDRNNGSVQMEGAVEYVPASEVERLRDAAATVVRWFEDYRPDLAGVRIAKLKAIVLSPSKENPHDC